MGHHHVPQAHLRRFEIDDQPGFVWMYDKKDKEFRLVKVKKIAQERDFYPQDIEETLAKEVEVPGNNYIDKLLKRELLTEEERVKISFYLMTMLTRGLKHREKAYNHINNFIDNNFPEEDAEINDIVAQYPDSAGLALEYRELWSRIRKGETNLLPPQIDRMVRTPYCDERMLNDLFNMRWHILPAPSNMFYVTSDTPAHRFDHISFARIEAQFTFALSKDYSLVGERRSRQGTAYEKLRANHTREVNRRIISYAQRFIFSPKKEPWIKAVADRSDHRFETLSWHSQ